ncbi:hypothetical protein [Peptacetobacter sp.]|uniref:hypothetical protein n=1 Tax=unclassified Peptacetobacter TaxID=2991974 RepID=UPI002E796A35|nr:hypothetical protein [Peptacetobacter sp.]MEE0451399.1 hypothetical protein [Peptacetobacter sp.]
MKQKNNINNLDNASLAAMMNEFEIKKAIELFSDLNLFLDKYKYCSCFVDNDEDYVSFLEYLEIEENLRMGYLI